MGSGLGGLASRRTVCRMGAIAAGRYGRRVLGRPSGLDVRAVAQLDCAARLDRAAATGATNDPHPRNRGREPHGQLTRSGTAHRREPRYFGISGHAASKRSLRTVDVRPRVLPQTVGVRGAVPVRAEDIRRRRDATPRTRASTRIRETVVQRGTATIAPARTVQPPQPLEKGAAGRLGDAPPRAAREAAPPSPAARPEPSRPAPSAPSARPEPARLAPQAPAARPEPARPAPQAPAARPDPTRPAPRAPTARPEPARPAPQAPAARPEPSRPAPQGPAARPQPSHPPAEEKPQ